MKGLLVNCPHCRKILFKNAYLRIGTFLTIKCFHCGMTVSVNSEPDRLRMTLSDVHKISTPLDLQDEDDTDIVSLTL